MTEVWYENPEVLLNNLNEFIPSYKLKKLNNINSIARFAIYLSIILLLLKLDRRWLLIPLLILFISYYLNAYAKPINTKIKHINNNNTPINNNQILLKTTTENPYMNYIINTNTTTTNPNSFPQILPTNLSINSDIPTNLNLFIKNEPFVNTAITQEKPLTSNIPICPTQDISTIPSDIPLTFNKPDILNNTINYDLCLTSNDNKPCLPINKTIENPENLPNKFKINNDLKKEIRKNYRSHLKFDSIDMWGKLINDRNYYTSPNIEIVNDQSGFAEWCYTNNGNSGKCKTEGSNCVKDRDVRYHQGRYFTN
jgi:hypothetical protein